MFSSHLITGGGNWSPDRLSGLVSIARPAEGRAADRSQPPAFSPDHLGYPVDDAIETVAMVTLASR